jgi:hypothetical protein
MKFDSADLGRLIDRTLAIECFEITLTQNTDQAPFVFSGPGCITLQSDGRLALKMYDAAKKSSIGDIARFFFHQTIGLVPESEYYSLCAKDAHGNLWISSNIYIRDGLSLTPNGTIIELDVPNIWATKSTRPRTDLIGQSIAEVIVLGKFRLPYNKFEDQADGSSSVTAIEFDAANLELKIAQKPEHLAINIVSKTGVVEQNCVVKVSEALGIAIGTETAPSYYRIYTEGRIDSFISGRKDVKGLGVMEPLVDVFSYKSEKFVAFMGFYIANRKKEHDHLISYWNRLYYVSDIITDVAALVLTVNIEGMVKNYFSKGRVPSRSILDEIEASAKLIKNAKLPDYTNSRISSCLGNLKKLTVTNILKELVVEGVVETGHVSSWISLRNLLAHADNVSGEHEAFGVFVENIYNCLRLFYRLIGLSVGYDERYVEQLISELESKG